MRRRTALSLFAVPALAGFLSAPPPVMAEESAWPDIKEALFGERELLDGSEVIRLEAPARALDAAIVPITVEALVPQGADRWIRTLHLVIDENPAPVAGVFHFTQASGKATISTRVRVNSYTNIHAVAETSDGRLWVTEAFVKAAGGCSAPSMKDKDEAIARLGRMKLKEQGPFVPGEVNQVQLLISHPQYTGMQIDQLTRNWIPPDYINSIKISQAGTRILEIESDISLSEDPAITFSYVPNGAGPLTVEVEDTEGRRFEESWSPGPAS
jgi:sulfur-oxidizing protein SoxY